MKTQLLVVMNKNIANVQQQHLIDVPHFYLD